MDTGLTGLLIFLALVVFISIPVHFFSKNIFFAAFVSGLISALILDLLDTIHLGYINPFFIIALFTSTIIGFVISLCIGLMLHKMKFISK